MKRSAGEAELGNCEATHAYLHITSYTSLPTQHFVRIYLADCSGFAFWNSLEFIPKYLQLKVGRTHRGKRPTYSLFLQVRSPGAAGPSGSVVPKAPVKLSTESAIIFSKNGMESIAMLTMVSAGRI